MKKISFYIYQEDLIRYETKQEYVTISQLVSDLNQKYCTANMLRLRTETITEYLKGTVPTKAEIKKIISDVISNVNKKMPTYKHIKNFVIRDKEFEKTTTKKIKRYGNNLKND